MTKLKRKNCKQCAKEFEPSRPLQAVCSSKCAYEYTLSLKAKKMQQMKENVLTISDLKSELQELVNKIVRTIDFGHPCISCGEIKTHYEAGHYWHKSKNSASECTFHLWNLHSQCKFCNRSQHGNLGNYSKGILKTYGKDTFDFLLNLPEMYRDLVWDKEELKEAIRQAKLVLKSLPNGKIYSVTERIELRKQINNQLNIYTL